MQIKSINGVVLFESVHKTITACMKEALDKSISLYNADLSYANLYNANLRYADLRDANLRYANLCDANLRGADLSNANLRGANLRYADLRDADFCNADLRDAHLSNANLSNANLSNAKNMVKIMGVEPDNIYWKRFDAQLKNNKYVFKVGINKLRDGEVFADDDRELCSYPGFHFASRSWCAANYPYRPFEAKIRIPEGAKINEPWATDGKASADMIEILQVFNTKTGEDVTDEFRRK